MRLILASALPDIMEPIVRSISTNARITLASTAARVLMESTASHVPVRADGLDRHVKPWMYRGIPNRDRKRAKPLAAVYIKYKEGYCII